MCCNHLLYQLATTLEIGYQRLNGSLRAETTDFLDGLHPMGGTQVRQVITIHRSNYRMTQLHQADALRHMQRFVRIQRQRMSAGRITKLTATRTDVATYHKSGCTLAPAFTAIGAPATTANGMQAMSFHNLLCLRISLIRRNADFQPLRLAYSFCLHFPFNSRSKNSVSLV